MNSSSTGVIPTFDVSGNGNNGGWGSSMGEWIIGLVALGMLGNGGLFGGFGGKGIKVCDEWKHIEGFINFYNWAISNGYSDELTLDRIDNEKDYCPENCRWITYKEQSNHRTNNVIYTINSRTQTATQWCNEYGISQTTLCDRLKRGWSLEQALTISTKGFHRKVNK